MSLATHYETVRDRHGYDRVDGIDVLAGLERRFVAVDGRETVAAALDRPTIVCMGAGTTGPPHLGTVGQILTGIELQEAGLDVQFVIADLEPYHGGADWDRVRTLAERYREFALGLGFDPDRGTLRTQSEATEVMATGHRLARYYAPDEWDDADETETAWSRAVRNLYERESTDEEKEGTENRDGEGGGNGGPTSEAASAHSVVLHGADFLHPLAEEDYEQVVVALGVDEHGLTPWTRQFLDATPVGGRVAGLHTRMVPGFDVPKMSKSIDAGLSLDTPPKTVRERILDATDRNEPRRSTVFQAMCLASRYDAETLDRLEAACVEHGQDWQQSRRVYAEYVAELAERWQRTDGD